MAREEDRQPQRRRAPGFRNSQAAKDFKRAWELNPLAILATAGALPGCPSGTRPSTRPKHKMTSEVAEEIKNVVSGS
jgi:hypothetical protein